MIVVLTGGTGGAKLVQGLRQIVEPGELTVIVNIGDDLEWWGLHISPDIDSVLYGLAGLLSKERGWGVADDSFRCLERMEQLGQPAWFSLGDLDLATHLTRTAMLRAGKTLSQATAELAARFGVGARVLPMSDDRVSTVLETSQGALKFQEYFVRERHRVEVQAVRLEGAEQARPAPGVVESIESADAIVLAPSNPVTSIGPILAVPGVRDALRRTAAPVVAVSPIVGGAAVSGPAAALMKIMGWPSTMAGVAQAYQDFLDVLVADQSEKRAVSAQDSAVAVQQPAIRRGIAENGSNDPRLTTHDSRFTIHDPRSTSVSVVYTNTIMRSDADKRELAAFVLDACAASQGAKAGS